MPVARVCVMVGRGQWSLVRGDHRPVGQVRYITVRNARLATAERLVRGVFLALAQTLSADEFADLQAQLSKDFAWLLPRESGRRGPPLEVLLDWVADPADRDLDAGCPAVSCSWSPPRTPRLPRSARTGSCDPLLPKLDRAGL